MDEPTLPPWGDDHLSTFLSAAQENERTTPMNMPDVYALLQRVDGTLRRAGEATEKDNRRNLLPRMLMRRAHGTWLAALRLALSAQPVECYPLLRAVIESAWYALHMAKDPAPPKRAQVWLGHGKSDSARKRCSNEFSIANVRATHRGLDNATEARVHRLYEAMIALGGHPNERGTMASMVRTDDGFAAVLLTNNPTLIAHSLKASAEVAVGMLKVFQLLYPERFAIVGLDRDIDKLVEGLNSVFRPYAAAARLRNLPPPGAR